MTASESAAVAATPATKGLGARFWKLWTSSTVSNLADGIEGAAVPLLAVLLTRDPLLVAGVTFAYRLPWLVFSPLSGVIVDRMDRRTVMSGAAACRAVLMALLAALVFLEAPPALTLSVLYVVVFLVGVAETIFDNGALAILPAVVPKEKLETANSRLFSAQTVTNQFAGPPIGSFLFALTAWVPFVGQALGFALAGLLLSRIQGDFQPKHQSKGSLRTVWPDMVEGFRWYFGHPTIRALGIGLGLINFSIGAAFATYVLYAQDVLGLNAAQFGFLLAAGALGGVASGFLSQRIIRRLGGGTTILAMPLVTAATLLALATVFNPFVAGAMGALSSFAAITMNIAMISFRQTVIPDRLLGRVTSAFRMVGVGLGALGAIAGGATAAAFGLTAPFWLASGLTVLTVLWLARYVNNRTIAAAKAEAEANDAAAAG